MLKKVVLISLLSCALMLTGCVNEKSPIIEVPDITPGNEIATQDSGDVEVTDNLSGENFGFDSFDSNLISFIDEEKSNENYMISPLSFKCALGLAIAGASGDTATELYDALGYEDFSDFENLISRLDSLNVQFDTYNKTVEGNKWVEESEKDGMMISFNVANSVWDVSGRLKDDYIKKVEETMKAEAKNTSIERVIEEVNTWVNDKTNGLIPTLLTVVPPDIGAILVNTVYLKSSWLEEFSVSKELMEFTDIEGNKVEKESMYDTKRYAYFKDDETELVIVPLNGGVNVAYVIGSNENIADKLDMAEKNKEIYVEVPKIEMETSFDKKELVRFLQAAGVKEAFMETANFDEMAEDMSIGDIIQKTKIKTDEKGLEAAAATAILMKDNAIIMNPEEPIRFVCDKPFSFYIYSEVEEEKDIMFYGNYVK